MGDTKGVHTPAAIGSKSPFRLYFFQLLFSTVFQDVRMKRICRSFQKPVLKRVISKTIILGDLTPLWSATVVCAFRRVGSWSSLCNSFRAQVVVAPLTRRDFY
jgi:hypothetical protein